MGHLRRFGADGHDAAGNVYKAAKVTKHIGWLCVLSAGVVIGSLLTAYTVQGIIRREADTREIRKATRMCSAWADRLAVIQPNGEFKREYVGQLPDTDPWGSNLVVEYFKVQRNSIVSMGIEHLRVISLGPDKQRYTDDDIIVDRASRFGPGVILDVP